MEWHKSYYFIYGIVKLTFEAARKLTKEISNPHTLTLEQHRFKRKNIHKTT